MTHPAETLAFLEGMRRRWETRARVDYRYFTESVNFDNPEVWDAQANREAALFLEGLDCTAAAAGRLLEIGCGPARLLARLAPVFRTAVGVDISPTMLYRAKQVCAGASRITLLRSGGADLAFFRDRSFFLVVMHAVAIHMPRELILRLLHEGKRVLSPGGRFRFTLNRRATAPLEMEAVNHFVASSVKRVPAGGEDLIHGLDYSGHRFSDEEIEPFLEGIGFGGFRVERVGLETFGVDAWR